MMPESCEDVIKQAQVPLHVSKDLALNRLFEHNKPYFNDDLTTSKVTETRIRLLDIQPGAFQDPIQAVLTTKLLEEELSYESLSYSWGSVTAESVHTITINGKAGFQVTPNAYLILQHVRHREHARAVWMDAICINQANLPEKHQQVKMMGKIYSLANCVVCWLGECGSNRSGVNTCTDHQIVRGERGGDEIECLESPLMVVGEDPQKEWWSRMWTVRVCCDLALILDVVLTWFGVYRSKSVVLQRT